MSNISRAPDAAQRTPVRGCATFAMHCCLVVHLTLKPRRHELGPKIPTAPLFRAGLRYFLGDLVTAVAPPLRREAPPVLAYHHALGALGPLVAAFLVTAWHAGRVGVGQLLRRMGPGGVQPFWYLVVLADTVAANMSARAVRLQHYGLSEEYPEFGVLGFFAFNLLFFGSGEETGWRGFALPRL